jgi:hypothetical protein
MKIKDKRQMSLFEEVGHEPRAGKANPPPFLSYRNGLLETIIRDTDTLKTQELEPWWFEFYSQRIASFREVLKEL